MCLILFSYNLHSDYRLILAANRDEFYARKTASLSFWKHHPGILAGRDLESGGTWLGISKSGRFAAITNYRDPSSIKQNAPSRGLLVQNYLCGNTPPAQYMESVMEAGGDYNGFNLLAGDGQNMYWYSNRNGDSKDLESGVYGLSNHLINTPWPKVRKGKNALESVTGNGGKIYEEDLFRILSDSTRPDDSQLPETGMGLEWERILSPLFISSEIYGTRSSAVLLIDRQGNVTFTEKTYIAEKGKEVKEGGTKKIEFQIETENV